MEDAHAQELSLAEAQQPHRPLEGLEIYLAMLIRELAESLLDVFEFCFERRLPCLLNL